jgi:hypothetical protein
LPAAPTLPPSVPVTEVPVVALQPVEAAPPPAPTSAPTQSQPVSQPTPAPNEADDDPFDIFDDENDSRIVPVAEEPLERVREMQEEMQENRPGAVPTLAPGEERRRGDEESDDVAEIETSDVTVPTPDIPAIEPRTVTGRDGSIEVVVPDVDAMIDEITARTTDPNRNPNVGDAARRALEDDDDDDELADDDDDRQSSNDKKRKSLRDRMKERAGRSSSSRDDDDDLVPNSPITNNNPAIGDSDGDCEIGDPNFPFC